MAGRLPGGHKSPAGGGTIAWTIVIIFFTKIKMSFISIPLFRSVGLHLDRDSSLTRMRVEYAPKSTYFGILHSDTHYYMLLY